MFDPISTYRIQFHKDFTFSDFRAAIPYLHRLGIKTIYASPIYQAVPGSMHGYDVVNPNRISSEIGTIDQLREISVLLKEAGMSWIQDIVPNHMGFHQHNEWLMDVLKKGGKSAYLTYFDLISTDLDKEPLMVPFLGDDLDNVIANGELELVDNNKGRFLKYYENHWPVREDIDLKGLDVGAVAQQQYYRLCCHRETNTTINYRRFFTVNSLICLNVQNQEVFSDYHGLTKSLIDEGIFQGLRIDHVDGLADPTAYMEQLRQLCGPEIYIVVEKILEPGEELPTSWPVQGTTGYDYLGMVNQLFTNDKAERNFDAFYKNLGRHTNEVQQLILKKKRTFLDCYMQGELENLYQLLVSLKLLDRQPDDEEASIFKAVISEILVRCPVYRFYSNQYPLLPEDLSALNKILE
ncbi:MAG: 4-alpha-glucanotransferase, partial [Chitinophagaceae bacterium]